MKTICPLLLLAFLISLGGSAKAQDNKDFDRFWLNAVEKDKGWARVCESDAEIVYFKTRSFRVVSPSIREAWVKFRTIDAANAEEDTATSTLELEQFDCVNRTSRVLNKATYNHNDKFLGAAEITKPVWIHYIPDTIGEAVWMHFCGDRKKKQ